MAGASKFGRTENGADCSKCGGTVAVLLKPRNGTSLPVTIILRIIFKKNDFSNVFDFSYFRLNCYCETCYSLSIKC